MLTKIAITKNNFDYQAFAELLEKEAVKMGKQPQNGYKYSEITIRSGDEFIVMNYDIQKLHTDGTYGPKQHRFMFISGTLTFGNDNLKDLPSITMSQLLNNNILSLSNTQYVVTDYDVDDDENATVLLGVFDTFEAAEKVANKESFLNTATITIVQQNEPCEIAVE